MKKILKASLIFVFALAVFGLWLIALFHISSLWRGDSDNAYLVIAGNAIAKGNYILRGYYLSQLDPFYPIDMFVNAAFVKLLGFRPLVMHAVPVFLYAVFILIACFYIPREKDEVNGNAGLIFKTGLFLFIIFLVFPSRGLAFWALQEGMHLSAVIVSLLVFLLINKFLKTASRLSYLFLTVAFIVLTAGFANDNVNVVICGVPLIVLSIVFIAKEVIGKDGNYNNIGKYLLIVLSVITAYLLKELIFLAIKADGGFVTVPSRLSIAFVRLKFFVKNFYFYINGMLNLLGIKVFGKNLFSLKTVIEIFKITGFIIFIYGIKTTVKKVKEFKDDDFLDILLLGGMLFMSLGFLMSQIPVNKASSRYLMPVAVFGFILIIRNFGYVINGFMKNKTLDIIKKDGVKVKNFKPVFLEISAAFVFMIYAGSFTLNSLAVIPKSPVKPLGKWLIRHNLTYGYGTYWDSSIITLKTKGKVKVRQLISGGNGIVPYRWLCNKKWYKEKGFFVIYTEHFIWFDRQAIIKVFGKPSKVYIEDFQGTLGKPYGRSSGRGTLAPYVIMVYKNGIMP